MLLKELISKNKILNTLMSQLTNEVLNTEVKGISSDSRNIKSGYIFVAIKGQKFDGNNFINEAQSNGAFLIVSESISKQNCILIKNGSSRLIYSILLSCFIKNQPNVIIGVTGTNGKTSTVDFCRQIWTQCWMESSFHGNTWDKN
jgi:UDP-N-acetylmuramyl tripeptide synthase